MASDEKKHSSALRLSQLQKALESDKGNPYLRYHWRRLLNLVETFKFNFDETKELQSLIDQSIEAWRELPDTRELDEIREKIAEETEKELEAEKDRKDAASSVLLPTVDPVMVHFSEVEFFELKIYSLLYRHPQEYLRGPGFSSKILDQMPLSNHKRPHGTTPAILFWVRNFGVRRSVSTENLALTLYLQMVVEGDFAIPRKEVGVRPSALRKMLESLHPKGLRMYPERGIPTQFNHNIGNKKVYFGFLQWLEICRLFKTAAVWSAENMVKTMSNVVDRDGNRYHWFFQSELSQSELRPLLHGFNLVLALSLSNRGVYFVARDPIKGNKNVVNLGDTIDMAQTDLRTVLLEWIGKIEEIIKSTPASHHDKKYNQAYLHELKREISKDKDHWLFMFTKPATLSVNRSRSVPQVEEPEQTVKVMRRMSVLISPPLGKRSMTAGQARKFVFGPSVMKKSEDEVDEDEEMEIIKGNEIKTLKQDAIDRCQRLHNTHEDLESTKKEYERYRMKRRRLVMHLKNVEERKVAADEEFSKCLTIYHDTKKKLVSLSKEEKEIRKLQLEAANEIQKVSFQQEQYERATQKLRKTVDEAKAQAENAMKDLTEASGIISRHRNLTMQLEGIRKRLQEDGKGRGNCSSREIVIATSPMSASDVEMSSVVSTPSRRAKESVKQKETLLLERKIEEEEKAWENLATKSPSIKVEGDDSLGATPRQVKLKRMQTVAEVEKKKLQKADSMYKLHVTKRKEQEKLLAERAEKLSNELKTCQKRLEKLTKDTRTEVARKEKAGSDAKTWGQESRERRKLIETLIGEIGKVDKTLAQKRSACERAKATVASCERDFSTIIGKMRAKVITIFREGDDTEKVDTWAMFLEVVHHVLNLNPDYEYRRFIYVLNTAKEFDSRMLSLITRDHMKRFDDLHRATTLTHEIARKALDHRTWLVCLAKMSMLDNLCLFRTIDNSFRFFSKSKNDASLVQDLKDSPIVRSIYTFCDKMKKEKEKKAETGGWAAFMFGESSNKLFDRKQNLEINLRELITVMVCLARDLKDRNKLISEVLMASACCDVAVVFQWISEMASSGKTLQFWEQFKSLVLFELESLNGANSDEKKGGINAETKAIRDELTEIVSAIERHLLKPGTKLDVQAFSANFLKRRSLKKDAEVELFDHKTQDWAPASIKERKIDAHTQRVVLIAEYDSSSPDHKETVKVSPFDRHMLRIPDGTHRKENIRSVDFGLASPSTFGGEMTFKGTPVSPADEQSSKHKNWLSNFWQFKKLKRQSVSRDSIVQVHQSRLIRRAMLSGENQIRRVVKDEDFELIHEIELHRKWLIYDADFNNNRRWVWPTILHLLVDAAGSRGNLNEFAQIIMRLLTWDSGYFAGKRVKLSARKKMLDTVDHNKRIPMMLALKNHNKGLFQILFEESFYSYLHHLDHNGNSLLHYLINSPLFSAAEIFGRGDGRQYSIRVKNKSDFGVWVEGTGKVVCDATPCAKRLGVVLGSTLIDVNGKTPLLRQLSAIQEVQTQALLLPDEDTLYIVRFARPDGYYIRSMCEKAEPVDGESFNDTLRNMPKGGLLAVGGEAVLNREDPIAKPFRDPTLPTLHECNLREEKGSTYMSKAFVQLTIETKRDRTGRMSTGVSGPTTEMTDVKHSPSPLLPESSTDAPSRRNTDKKSFAKSARTVRAVSRGPTDRDRNDEEQVGIIDLSKVKLLDSAFFMRLSYFFRTLHNHKGLNPLESFLQQYKGNLKHRHYTLFQAQAREARHRLGYTEWRTSHVYEKVACMIEHGASLSVWMNMEEEKPRLGEYSSGKAATAYQKHAVEDLQEIFFEMMRYDAGTTIMDRGEFTSSISKFVSKLQDVKTRERKKRERKARSSTSFANLSQYSIPTLKTSASVRALSAITKTRAILSKHRGQSTPNSEVSSSSGERGDRNNNYSWRMLTSAVQQANVDLMRALTTGKFAQHQLPKLSNDNVSLLHLACDDWFCIRRSREIVELILDYNSMRKRHIYEGLFHPANNEPLPGQRGQATTDPRYCALSIDMDHKGPVKVPLHLSHNHMDILFKTQISPFTTHRRALHYASSSLNTDAGIDNVSCEITKVLLRRHVKMGAFDEYGMSELHYAVLSKHLLTIDELTNYTDLNIATKPVNQDQKVAPVDAAGMMFLSYHDTGKGLDEIPVQSRHCRYRHGGETGLHLAASNGLVDVAAMLLKKGANKDSSDRLGLTPLGSAMMRFNTLRKFLGRMSLYEKDLEPRGSADYKGTITVRTQLKASQQTRLKGSNATSGRPRLEATLIVRSEVLEALRELRGDLDTMIQLLIREGSDLDLAQKFSGTSFEEIYDIPKKFKAIVEQEKLFAKGAYDCHDARKVRSIEDSVKNLFDDRMNQIVCDAVYRMEVRGPLLHACLRYILFLVVLSYAVVQLATQDRRSSFWFHNALVQTLVLDEFPYEVSHLRRTYQDIDSIEEFWLWMKGPFTDMFYPSDVWNYREPDGTQKFLRGYFGGQSRILGVPRLRQIRSKITDCSIPKEAEISGEVCFTQTGCNVPIVGCSEGIAQNDQNYTAKTSDGLYLSQTCPAFDQSICLQTYPFKTSEDLQSQGSLEWGQYNQWYPVSGYVQNFPNPRDTNAANATADLLTSLIAIDWIDQLTRVVMVEFSLINSHTNDYCSSNMMIEFPLVGGVVTSYDFHVGRFIHYQNGGQLLYLEIVIAICFMLYLFGELEAVSLLGTCKYLSSASHAIMCAMITIFFILFAIFIYRDAIEQDIDWTATDKYVPLDRLSLGVRVTTSLLSLLIALAWWQLMNYLSIFKAFSELLIMIEFMLIALIPLGCCLIFVLASFAFAEYVAYGYQDPQTQIITLSMGSRLVETFDGIDYLTVQNFDRVMGTFWSIAFVIFLGVLVLNLIIAVLTHAYESAREQIGKRHWAHHQYKTIMFHWIVMKERNRRLQKMWGCLTRSLTCRCCKTDDEEEVEEEEKNCLTAINSATTSFENALGGGGNCVRKLCTKCYNCCVIPASKEYMEHIYNLNISENLGKLEKDIGHNQGMESSMHRLPKVNPHKDAKCCCSRSKWCIGFQEWCRHICSSCVSDEDGDDEPRGGLLDEDEEFDDDIGVGEAKQDSS